jgi:serine/threonine protein kinase
MLQKEYNLLKRLADDNIIKVYDFTEDASKNEAYLIMEYFTGINLDEYIEENGVLTEKESAIVLYQILSSVQYLHELGIAHRDIKPENILINEDKEIKLIDFNISKARNSEVISWGESKFTAIFHTQISSPLYWAPEIKEQTSYTESVDIWGIGIILFTMLFGSLKLHSLNRLKTAKERSSCIVGIINDQRSVSDEWKLYLLNMLAVSAHERPTAEEALENEWFEDKID